MNEPETLTRAGPVPTLRTPYLALLTLLILTRALQSAGGLLDGFWLGRPLGVRGIATAASFFPVFFLLLSLIIGLGAGAASTTVPRRKKMDSSTDQTSRSARRVAARQARDAFPPMGIYAIRDRASGHLLLGASRNVHTAVNRARFELRMGKHADRELQAACNCSGVEGLTFEVLELVKKREDAHFDYAGELKALEHIHRELQGLTP